MWQGWVNNFYGHYSLELRTILAQLLPQNKYFLKLCCQQVQKYMILCISLETIIEF